MPDTMMSLSCAGDIQLSLLGSFACQVDDEPIELPHAGERLIAFLALQSRPVTRLRAAGVLWPDAREERALGSLRSTLWRLRNHVAGMIEAADTHLRLAPAVALDTAALSVQTHDLIDDRPIDCRAVDAEHLRSELLPGWYDDWVVFERERMRQLSLHALEALSRRQAAEGRFAAAIESAMMAVSLEPLRESSHDALIGAHLAEGNICEAIRRLGVYTDALAAELGVGPSERLVARVESALDRSRTPRVIRTAPRNRSRRATLPRSR